MCTSSHNLSAEALAHLREFGLDHRRALSLLAVVHRRRARSSRHDGRQTPECEEDRCAVDRVSALCALRALEERRSGGVAVRRAGCAVAR